MSTQPFERQPLLSEQVAANIRAEAARKGWSQGRVALAMGMSRIAVSDRYRGKTPWTVDETQRAAHVFGVPLSALYAIRDSNPEPAAFRDNVVDLREWRARTPVAEAVSGTARETVYGPAALWGRLEVVQ